MKDGDKWTCPNCGDSFLVKKAVYDGFTKTCDVLKCAFCGAIAEELSENAENEPEITKNVDDVFGDTVASKGKHDSLDDLFGGKAERTKVPDLDVLLGGKTERRFCRDCAFRAINAFTIFCSKHDKNVEPLESCPDFQPLESQKKE